MARPQIEAFQQLINSAKKSTMNAMNSSPMKSMSAGLAGFKYGLAFEQFEDENFDLAAVKVPLPPGSKSRAALVDDDLSLDPDSSQENKMTVTVNWLVIMFRKFMTKINEHAELIKMNTKMTDSKANQEDVKQIKEKYKELEKECNEIRQRNMKGNIVISAPSTGQHPSLMRKQRKHNEPLNSTVLESDVDLVTRLILKKTGIIVPETDIMACHALPSRGGQEPSYIVRFGNRREGSAWDILAAGLLTGKHKYTKAFFSKDPIYINFQLTKNNNELMKVVRKAKTDGQIIKYGVDQNARVTVKAKKDSVFETVATVDDLKRIVANPTMYRPRN